MAGSDGSSEGASQPPKFEATISSIKIPTKLPRRQLTLISITVCLNVLLWSSIFVLITSLYLIASDPDDTTNIPTEVLSLTSCLVSIAYIIIHTIFSLKQRIWKHQRRHPSIIKKTSYVAVRFAVTLCVLWLLTSGWNMITVARRPVCLPADPLLGGWEAGTTCVVGRAGMAISLIALIAACTLFGMLATVRRPFEAHVFKHGYREPLNHRPTPVPSRRSSPARSASFMTETYHGRVSASTFRSTPSSMSNTDVETIDLNSGSPPSTIHAPSPIRKIGLGIFTSHQQPPPLPTAHHPPRSSSLETPPPIFQPSIYHQHLPPPPRMSALVAPSGFVPLSIPAQFSASAWKAVHPTLPSPLGPTASRSHTNLQNTASGYNHNFPYRSRYSRSSVSLTRPHRLSSAPPIGSVAWSSRSGSTGPDEGRGSPSGSTTTSERVPSQAIAYAILNGTTIPGTQQPTGFAKGHIRRASAPDATTNTEQQTGERMAKGWKPILQPSDSTILHHPAKIARSSSAEMLSKFSPDSSPDTSDVSPRTELERELANRLSQAKRASIRKSRSESPMQHPDAPIGPMRISRMPQEPYSPKRAKRMTFDDVKNKPLPKIAAL